MRIPFRFIVPLVVFTQMGNTDCGAVIKDPGFDLWCGDSLCAWKTERGEIKRVPTWHDKDSGVQLVGEDTAIEQLASFNSGDGTCITFDLVANVDDNAEVYLNVDVEDDGILEMHERIPTSHWKPLTYTIAFKTPFDGVRFELAKKGTGNAVLANIAANTVDAATCAGLTQLDPGPRKNGATCGSNDDCASGICAESPTPVVGTLSFGTVCMGCVPSVAEPQSTCGTGMTCGLAAPVAPIFSIPVECIPAQSKQIGERCYANPDCASGVCVFQGHEGYCSSCWQPSGCASGDCRQTWIEDNGFGPVTSGPATCSNGAHGDACAADADCTSGHCTGTPHMECTDGRACATRDDCPVADDLTPGPCNTVGIQGGSCE